MEGAKSTSSGPPHPRQANQPDRPEKGNLHHANANSAADHADDRQQQNWHHEYQNRRGQLASDGALAPRLLDLGHDVNLEAFMDDSLI